MPRRIGACAGGRISTSGRRSAADLWTCVRGGPGAVAEESRARPYGRRHAGRSLLVGPDWTGKETTEPMDLCGNVGHGQQRLAADRGDAGRPDERPRPRRALRRRDAEALVGELDDDGVRRVRARAHRLGSFGFKMALRRRRCTSSEPSSGDFFGNFVGQARARSSSSSALLQTRRTSRRVRRRSIQLPAVDAGLLPVRLRGDHADPDARLGARPDQLQGLDPVRGALVVLRLHGQRLPDLGRRLLRPARARSTSPAAT